MNDRVIETFGSSIRIAAVGCCGLHRAVIDTMMSAVEHKTAIL